MTLSRPGSAPWLLRHELRLAWRRVGGVRGRIWAALGALLWLAYHGAAWLLLRDARVATLPPATTLLLGAALWIAFMLMLSHAITYAVEALFDRGDLDLLLSSPLAPRTVFAVRGLGIAVACATLYALLLWPFANVGLALGQPRLFAAYPALAALALLAAATGMAATLLLVRWLGARRARVAAQLLGAVVGAFFFLVLQASNLFGDDRVGRWWAAVRDAAADGTGARTASLVRLPFAALTGEPLALAICVAAGCGAFALVVAATGRRFLAGTQESTTDAPAGSTAERPVARFRSRLWRVVLVKEWKLIGRDPQLIGQTLLQMLYLLPLAFVWHRSAALNQVLAPAVVVAATALASGLAWIMVAAEDAPELVATAPVALSRVRRIKLVAALLPVWLLVAPLLAYLASRDAAWALVLAGCLLGSTVSVGILHLEISKPGDRRQMARRGRGNIVGALLETVVALAWAALAWCLLAASWAAPFAAALALAPPLAATMIGRARRRAAAAA